MAEVSAPAKPVRKYTLKRKTDVQPKEQNVIEAAKVSDLQDSKATIPVITGIDDWAKLRQKYGEKYAFTPAGDLVGPNQTILEMVSKVPANTELIQQRLEEKKIKIAEAEEKFTTARRQLFDVIAQYRADSTTTTIQDVISANQAVHVADCALSLLAKYPRYIKTDNEYIYRDIHLDDFYNVRKIPDPVLEIETTTFPISLFWTDKIQERINFDDYTETKEEKQNEVNAEQAKRDAARTGAIIAANRAKANAMAGRG
jgi:hypothetical protein